MAQHAFETGREYADAVAWSGRRLQGVDVRVKLAVALTALGVTIGARGPALPLAMLAASVAACLAMRVRPGLLAARLAAPFSVAAVVMAGQLFFWKGQPLFALSVGPWTVTATQEGLSHGMLIGARVLGAVGIVLALSFSTPFPQLLAAARWLRAPAIAVELAALIYRYLFLLREEAETMLQAQRARLGYADRRRGLRSAAALGGMAFVRVYDRATDIHRAMLCRGYTGEFQGTRLLPAGRREALHLLTGLTLLAVVYCLSVW
ncbi:MAG: cobalt ECF transporter T component CbiQ [Armatimonadetes bacterium]|nr:cobalt ECF transporter T component CbiQ [Armatimonadota bacterium]